MNRAIESLLLALLIYTPLVLGGVRLWAITAVHIAAIVMLCLYLIRLCRHERPPFRVTIIGWPLVLFLAVAGSSFFISCYRHASLLALYRIATYVIVYYCVVSVASDRTRLTRLVGVIVGMGALLSFVGIILYLGHRYYGFWLPGSTLSATFVNRDHFAGYLEMVIPLAVGLFCADISRTQKSLVLSLVVLMVIAFILAASRGAWVSLVFACLIILPFVTRRRLLQTVALLVIVAGAVLCYALSHFDLTIAGARARTIIDGAGVDSVRMITWLGTLDLIRVHPVLGSGIGTFLYAFQQFRLFGINQVYLMDYAHNDYLQIAAETGLVGLALMIWAIVAAVWVGLAEFFRTQNPLKKGIALGATMGVMSMAMHSVVDFCLHIPANAILFVTILGIITAIYRRRYD